MGLARRHQGPLGRAVAGPFGRDERFDVIGNEVNVAATLPARTLSLSAEAFRCLASAERAGFKKHTAPVVYIPVDDPRPCGGRRAPIRGRAPAYSIRLTARRSCPALNGWASTGALTTFRKPSYSAVVPRRETKRKCGGPVGQRRVACE